MGAQRSVQDDVPNNGEGDGETRIVRLDGGVRWRASMVARLISEDVPLRRESARLVLRFECLTAVRPPKRGSVAGVSSLAEVSDEALRALITGGSTTGERAAARRAPSQGR